MTFNTSVIKKAESQVSEKRSALDENILSMTLPTGRIQNKVLELLNQIGINVSKSERSYKPTVSVEGMQVKMLKGQNIPELVELGRHDCGFSGYDWIVEREADVVELLDLGFDPVKIVAAIPEDLLAERENGFANLGRQLIVASEYRNLTASYIKDKGLEAVFLQTFGATEALPPEDADMIVDNTATGTTLKQNRLAIVDELLKSTTRFICNKKALENPVKRKMLDEMVMLMESCLRARNKVLLEMHFSCDDFEKVIKQLPCMKSPTVSKLYGDEGYAVKIAVENKEIPTLIPRLISLGARDILEFRLEKIVI
jgi:ATP phosphoribosyltransferase